MNRKNVGRAGQLAVGGSGPAGRWLPAWLRHYRRGMLAGDFSAGLVVAMMLLPQSMAYALVAGLPPVTGIYASIAPPLLYALFGTSMSQSVGPMAIISLMTASVLAGLAPAGSALYGVLAAQLALMAGVVLLACGVARVGFLANFFSRPVMSGFTLGSALLIAWGQLPSLLGGAGAGATAAAGAGATAAAGASAGATAAAGAATAADVAAVLATPVADGGAGIVHLGAIAFQPATAIVGLAAVLLLVLARRHLAPLLRRAGLPAPAAATGARLAPMLVVAAGSVAVAAGLAGGVATIGAVPAGLPTLNLALAPAAFKSLLQPALLIGFMTFLIAMSSAQALAQASAQAAGGSAGAAHDDSGASSDAAVAAALASAKPRANAELLGLGLANLGSAFSGGFPVTGSMSRAAVNYSAGANTPLASIVSAALLGLALVAPTGYLALVPMPVLAATIIVAVLGMLDLDTLRIALRYDRSDAVALLATAAGVLGAGVEAGVVIGVLLSMGTLIWRASRPHIAVLGRIAGSEHFRNVERHPGGTVAGLLLLRVDAFLFFGNIEAVAARIDDEVAARPGLRDLVLVLSAVNAIDTSALFGLAEINRKLQAQGIVLHLAEVKGPVMDRLKGVELLDQLSGQVFLSTANAWDALSAAATARQRQ